MLKTIVRTGVLPLIFAARLSAAVITGWDFQNGPAATNLSPAPDMGTVVGVASTVGMTNAYPTPGPSVDISDITASTGSSDPAGANNNAWRIRGGQAAGQTLAANGWSSLAPIGTQGAQFTVSTVGFTGIKVTFDVETTGQAEANLQLQYTLDGTTWTNYPITYTGAGATVKTNNTSTNTVNGTYIQFTGGSWFNGITADFTSVAGANNNPKFGIRMVNASTGADDINGSGAAYNNNSGNWRFDEVIFSSGGAPVFASGNLVVSRSVYVLTGDVANLQVGGKLPDSSDGVTPFVAVASGAYPNVFNNASVDGSFGVASPVFLDQLTPSGTLVSTLAVPTSLSVTSFPSKSELALNLSSDSHSLIFMGYAAGVGVMDVSNSNTPGIIEPGNFVTTTPTYRTIVQVDVNGNFQVTTSNAYSGNNGRAAIAANGLYYMVGNAGNGNGSAQITTGTGVQAAVPGQNATAAAPGTVQVGSFNITQLGLPADKSAKDNNYRGETIFNNTLYVTKGSGSNGVNTVYQVGASGTPPTLTNASTTPITILPGFSTTPARAATGVTHPFGIWFANATTLYVGDEGDGVLADLTNGIDPASGLQKWTLVNGTWKLAYTMQTGLNLGINYTVSDGQGHSYFPTATDGLRNITGKVNGDGTVTIYAISSTVSASGDQGADPNKLYAITDTVANTAPGLAATETFVTLRSAAYGEVLRGVSITPTTVPPPTPAAPAIASQPQSSITAGTGGTVAFGVAVSGFPAPTCQWFKNGAALSGATQATLVIGGATAANSGSYTCVVTNSLGSVTSNPAALTVVGTPNMARLANLSARGAVGPNGQPLVIGFVVGDLAQSDPSPCFCARSGRD